MILKIEKLVFGGNGAGDAGGKKIFVPFSAPGDVLEVETADDHGTYASAQITKIIEPALCRVNPPCPVFGKCGGCQWQHISYNAQLEWKRKILIETLGRIGKLSVADEAVLPTLRSPCEWHYRNRIQLHVDSKGRVGFYRQRSKEVVEFEECLIAEEDLNCRLNEMRGTLRKRRKGIAFRKGDGPSFTQINTLQNEQMKKILMEWLNEMPHDKVLELYAGAGNFTFQIAAIASRVIASDIDGKAIRHAKDTQKARKADNIEFFRESAEKTAERFKGVCDAVILDPPRKGCKEAIEAISSLKPASIIYISCDPATLARDLNLFRDHSYNLARCLPVDMFPQTYHIESINLLSIY
jgi:23S rRNA (uracil1939-C5)-methyltransferase